MTEYTVTEALVKLKLTDKKVADSISCAIMGLVGTNNSKVAPAGYKSTEDFKSEVRSRYDSAVGLISFRDKLKKAIVESNAKTEVVVGSTKMTVAEAIEKKRSVSSRKSLLDKLANEWRNLELKVNNQNATLENRADQYVAQLVQQNSSLDKDEIRKSFIANNLAIIVTHEGMKKYVEALKNEIDEFETNVDVALSVVNATTKISVS